MAKPFNPGAFRHKAEFLSPPGGTTATGAPSGDRPVFKTAFVSVEPILGRELYAALTADSNVTVKIRSRYIEGVNDFMRIRVGDDVYDISSIVDIMNSHKEFLMYCVKV